MREEFFHFRKNNEDFSKFSSSLDFLGTFVSRQKCLNTNIAIF